MRDISKNKKIIMGIGIILLLIIIKNNSIITRGKLAEYKTLDEKIQELEESDLTYYENNREEISKYLDLKKKYESVEESFNNYKNKYPDDLSSEIDETKDEVNKYYKEAINLENKLKEEKAAKAKKEQQIASSNSQGNSYSNSNGNYYSSGGNSSYNHGHNHNNSLNKHIGKSVYIANGNSYYHAISNCKYLEGAKTQLVTLTSGMRKYECNCWTNPVPYKKPVSNNNGGSSHSGGRTVYIASGNSYYHKTPYCKHLRGASTRAVGINNVGGKHPCNCIKY